MSFRDGLPEYLQGTAARGLVSEGQPVAQYERGAGKNFVYLVLDWATRKAALVDCQKDLGPVWAALKTYGFALEKVLLTHTHFDHIAGLEELLAAVSDLRVHVHPLDAYRLRGIDRERLVWVEDQQLIQLGATSIEVLHTPGHSAGEVCYRVSHSDRFCFLFTGDTLFIRECGRTDLETGSDAEMFASLQRLSRQDPRTIVLPGHHYAPEVASTIGEELQTNPALRCRSVEELAALP